MSNIRVELNHAGMNQLLHSEEMRACLQEYAEQVQSRCTVGNVSPDEYRCSVKNAGSRLVARVFPDTKHAFRSNRKHETLTKALWG